MTNKIKCESQGCNNIALNETGILNLCGYHTAILKENLNGKKPKKRRR